LRQKRHLKVNSSEEVQTNILRNSDIFVKSECATRKTETKKLNS